MVIPTGNVGDPISLHCLGLVDEVLEYLVERMAHMNIAVREGRAVVERKSLAVTSCVDDLVIKTDTVPVLDSFGLSLGKVCLHRKFCFG